MNEIKEPNTGMKLLGVAIIFGVLFFKFDRFMGLVGAKTKGRK